MNLRELPFGNGQEVYIEPEWLEKECKGGFYRPQDHDKTLVRNLVEHLYNNGYTITSDSKTVSDDAFFFNPCLDKHINEDRDDYINKKKAMIDNCLSSEKVKAPLTKTFPENSFPNILPEDLPIVIKNENKQGGKDKYLIKTVEQLEIFKKFYNEINAYDKKIREESIRQENHLSEDVVWDENGHSKQTYWSIMLGDYKKNLYEDFVIQKFIKTPTKYNTSLRVVTSSSGDMLCASLKYADETITENKKFNGLYEKYLSDPASPYYLGSESIISNTVSGGNSILLGSKNYSELEQEILRAHGIDPNNAVIPQDVVSSASKIAILGRRSIGAISGMDFIFDKEENTWKYLEEHEYPMLNTYAQAYGLLYESTNNYDSFLYEHFVTDIDARLLSLSLSMKKKQALNFEEDQSFKKN